MATDLGPGRATSRKKRNKKTIRLRLDLCHGHSVFASMTNLESGPRYAEICCQTISCLSVCLSIKFRNLTPSLAIKLFTTTFVLAKFEQAKNLRFCKKFERGKNMLASKKEERSNFVVQTIF